MKLGTSLTAILLLVFISGDAYGRTNKSSVLDNLKPEHPRLMVHDSDVVRVKELIRTNPEARQLYEKIQKEADELLTEPPMDYEAVDYRKNIISIKVLLGKIRGCVDRVYILLTVYRIDGDKKYMERAKQEIMEAIKLPDWNPNHFLDTAEMTHAVAIGYDWMYHDLSDDERQLIRNAIIEKGLKPARKMYRTNGYIPPLGFWVRAKHNWNQVCNGGIAIGALAIADEEPELAEEILTSAIKSIRIAMAEFSPDGAWAEGPSYWSYATEYNVFFLAGLQTALGDDFGLLDTPGFSETGMFRIHYIGPLGLTFNYADAPDTTSADEQMFWMSRVFDEPLYAWHAKKYLPTTEAIGLWWYNPEGETPKDLPLDAFFEGADIVFMRSDWEDPDAVFIGFKGGDNKTNHSHLDLGTFVLDALGVRWAVDLGRDSYKLPLYFDVYLGNRWRYYRLLTNGHNTPVLNGKNQGTRAKAPIIKFDSTPGLTFAVADLTDGYKSETTSVLRGIAMVDRSRILIQDEIEGKKPLDVVWGFHTKANINIDGKKAVLKQDDSNLLVKIIEPKEAFFKVVSASQPPPQASNEGVNNLTVQLPEKVKSARIVVELIPFKNELIEPSPRNIMPLQDW
jgi:Domain of unknown function (DUF4962)/Heparinase II/III-like protein